MNDFTKDDLEQIYDALMLKWTIEENPLLDKIDALIESYCEHSPEPSHEICCTKCQRTLI